MVDNIIVIPIYGLGRLREGDKGTCLWQSVADRAVKDWSPKTHDSVLLVWPPLPWEHPYLIGRNDIWGMSTSPITGPFQNRDVFYTFPWQVSNGDPIDLQQLSVLPLACQACGSQQSWTKLHTQWYLRSWNRMKCLSCTTKPGQWTQAISTSLVCVHPPEHKLSPQLGLAMLPE